MTVREIDITDSPQLEKLCSNTEYISYTTVLQTLCCSWIKGYVAVDDEGIAGYLSVSFAEWYGKRAQILSLVISRGPITGKLLIAHIWKIFKQGGYKRITCVTKPENKRMREILIKGGWIKEANLEQYDPKGEGREQYVRFVEEGYRSL